MKRFAPRVTILLLFTIIGVLVGMEWTRSGIERVYGPMSPTASTEASTNLSSGGQEVVEKEQRRTQVDAAESDSRWEAEWNQQIKPATDANRPTEEQTAEEWEKQMPEHLGLPPIEEPPVNQLADKTAGFLSRLSEAGIQAVVGIFDRLF